MCFQKLQKQRTRGFSVTDPPAPLCWAPGYSLVVDNDVLHRLGKHAILPQLESPVNEAVGFAHQLVVAVPTTPGFVLTPRNGLRGLMPLALGEALENITATECNLGSE